MGHKGRCPKCNEENPPDAKICWACYTPLEGTVISKKLGGQPWQFGVIAVGLILALFMVGKSFFPKNSSKEVAPPNDDFEIEIVGMGDTPPPTAYTPTSSDSSNNPAPAPQKLPFSIAMAPNPSISVGTMAIVSNDPHISPSDAANLASFARNQFSGISRWKTIYIYVFPNREVAKQFTSYLRQRRGMPLRGSDYRNLTSLWGNTLACYEYSNGGERIYLPSENPNGWWQR